MGQAKSKQLDCPATGRRISPQECGENRISSYPCPAECPHNPWIMANYDRALEIYDRFADKMVSRLRAEQVRIHGYAPTFPDGLKMETLEWFSAKLYRETDDRGLTCKQRWEAERYAGLNNDQRVYLEAEAGMRPALLEVREVLSDTASRAVDLLSPDEPPFLLADRSFNRRACRFSTLFAMVFDLPCYRRIHSVACEMPHVPGMGAREVLLEVAAHLGGPRKIPELRAWLAANLARVDDGLQAVTMARHEAMLRGVDAAYTRSVYDLACTPEEVRRILAKQRDIDAVDLGDDAAEAGFAEEWVCLSGKKLFRKGQDVLGRLLLHADGYLQLEASSAKRTAQLKQRIEKLFGDSIRFSRERTDDLGRQCLDRRRPSYDTALVPPRLMENTAHIETSVSRIPIGAAGEAPSKEEIEATLEREFNRTFLDRPLDLLDGLTPRQAARKSALRPRLVELMKSHVRTSDEKSLRSGADTDITWMLDELGLDEIKFPPPPPRSRFPAGNEDEDGDGLDDEWDEDEYEEGPEDAASHFMLDEDDIDERNAGLDKDYPGAKLAERFAELHPQAAGDLAGLCGAGQEEALGTVLDLAARVAFLQFIPPMPFDREIFAEWIEDQQDLLVDRFQKMESNPLERLKQPFLSKYVIEELEKRLRFGKADPLYVPLYIYLTAFAETVHRHHLLHLLWLLQEARRKK